MKKIRSEIVIGAPASLVWDIITDFNSYPLWNTFTPRITLANDRFVVGEEFDLDCRMSDRLLLENEHEVILAKDTDNYRFCMGTSRIKGRPGIKSFRWQICESLGNDRTHFVNYEQFHGPLAPLVYFMYAKRLRKAFERYCSALKHHTESKING
jgi:hypothetical protein